MARRRDYAAEYRQRVAKGEQRGLSRSQAAGHPKAGELPVSGIKRLASAIFGKLADPWVKGPQPWIAPPQPQPYELPTEHKPLDYTRVPPEESSIGPPGPDDFDTMLSDLIVGGEVEDGDAFAADLLYQGWYNTDNTADQRAEARAMFFDYTGMDRYDFDWDAWRDWYETV